MNQKSHPNQHRFTAQKICQDGRRCCSCSFALFSMLYRCNLEKSTQTEIIMLRSRGRLKPTCLPCEGQIIHTHTHGHTHSQINNTDLPGLEPGIQRGGKAAGSGIGMGGAQVEGFLHIEGKEEGGGSGPEVHREREMGMRSPYDVRKH